VLRRRKKKNRTPGTRKAKKMGGGKKRGAKGKVARKWVGTIAEKTAEKGFPPKKKRRAAVYRGGVQKNTTVRLL